MFLPYDIVLWGKTTATRVEDLRGMVRVPRCYHIAVEGCECRRLNIREWIASLVQSVLVYPSRDQDDACIICLSCTTIPGTYDDGVGVGLLDQFLYTL